MKQATLVCALAAMAAQTVQAQQGTGLIEDWCFESNEAIVSDECMAQQDDFWGVCMFSRSAECEYDR